MDSLEVNKMAGGLLGTMLFAMGLGVLSDALFAHPHLAKPGYDLPSVAEGHGATPAAVHVEPLPALLAKADPKKGETAAKICTTCHTLNKDDPDKPTGPNLAGVVGRKMGSTGFAYSEQMKAMSRDWTYEDINTFIANPKAFVPGTKMQAFGGVPDPAKRADILAYLRSISPAAPPFPAQ